MKGDFFKKFIFYVIIGIYGVLIDSAVSNFFYNLPILPSHFRDTFITIFTNNGFATISAFIGGIAGLINNFLMNEVLVYNIKKETNRSLHIRFGKYVLAAILGTFIIGKFLSFNIFLTFFKFGFSTSNLLAIAIGTFINYPINYFWTWGDFQFFKRKEKIS